jgi:hypothetical protein
VPIQVNLDRIASVGADLDETGPEASVVDMEAVVVDTHGVVAVLETHKPRLISFSCVKSLSLVLGYAGKHDTFRAGEVLAVLGCYLILALAWFKVDDRNPFLLRKSLDTANEVVGDAPQQYRGRDLVPKMRDQRID